MVGIVDVVDPVDIVGALTSGGTGSRPPGFHGWQRSSRRTASQVPRSGPCAVIASTA